MKKVAFDNLEVGKVYFTVCGIWQEQFDRTTLGCLGSDFFEYASVIAWMPLPEPYKEESEEQKNEK